MSLRHVSEFRQTEKIAKCWSRPPAMEEAYVIAQNTSGAASTSTLPFASASTALDAETLLLTTQGDGIHLTAVEDSTPLSSLTLGPSTRFATPAVARRRPNSKECDICSGMLNQPEIWHWRAEMKGDSTFVKEPEKRVKKVSLTGSGVF